MLSMAFLHGDLRKEAAACVESGGATRVLYRQQIVLCRTHTQRACQRHGCTGASSMSELEKTACHTKSRHRASFRCEWACVRSVGPLS